MRDVVIGLLLTACPLLAQAPHSTNWTCGPEVGDHPGLKVNNDARVAMAFEWAQGNNETVAIVGDLKAIARRNPLGDTALVGAAGPVRIESADPAKIGINALGNASATSTPDQNELTVTLVAAEGLPADTAVVIRAFSGQLPLGREITVRVGHIKPVVGIRPTTATKDPATPPGSANLRRFARVLDRRPPANQTIPHEIKWDGSVGWRDRAAIDPTVEYQLQDEARHELRLELRVVPTSAFDDCLTPSRLVASDGFAPSANTTTTVAGATVSLANTRVVSTSLPGEAVPVAQKTDTSGPAETPRPDIQIVLPAGDITKDSDTVRDTEYDFVVTYKVRIRYRLAAPAPRGAAPKATIEQLSEASIVPRFSAQLPKPRP